MSKESQHRRDLAILKVLIDQTPSVALWETSRNLQEMVFTDRKRTIIDAAIAMDFTPMQIRVLKARLDDLRLPAKFIERTVR